MNNQKMLVIGLTGQTGAGKSTFGRMFAACGVEMIDADKVARDTLDNSTACLMDLVLEYSTEVIHPNATLNREKLSAICFGNRQKLRRLNEITLPYIIEAVSLKIEEAEKRGASMLLLDAPTLFESGMDARCDIVVALLADVATRTRRIIERDGISEEAATRRVNAQNVDAYYAGRADEIITNNGDLDALRLSFLQLFARLEAAVRDGVSVRAKPPAPDTDAAGFGELASPGE